MAFRSIGVSAPSGVATQLFVALAGDVEVWVSSDANDTFRYGGPGVTQANGLRLSGGAVFSSHVRPGDELWVWADTANGFNVLVRSA